MNPWKIENIENGCFQYCIPCSTEFIPANFHYQSNFCLGQPISFPFFVTMPSFNENSNRLGQNSWGSQMLNEFQTKLTQETEKSEQKVPSIESKKIQKKDGNTKANIIRDFVRSLKKDATPALLAKQSLDMDFSLKKFMELLDKYFPSDEKYYRFKKLLDICRQKQDQGFSRLFRTLFYNFLKGEYQIKILLKKKNKSEYFKVCRQMMLKLVQTAS